jgi:hypothetical protein
MGTRLNKTVFILLWMVSLSILSCDRVSKRYDSYTDVLAAEDNYKAWLPPFIVEEKYGFFDSVSKIEEKFDLDTNRIWGKCNIRAEKMNEFGYYFLQDIKARWVFGNEQLNFGNINFDNFTFFVDINNGPFWYYALDETRMIVYFFSESREYYSKDFH